jgi:hypothetical protein
MITCADASVSSGGLSSALELVLFAVVTTASTASCKRFAAARCYVRALTFSLSRANRLEAHECTVLELVTVVVQIALLKKYTCSGIVMSCLGRRCAGLVKATLKTLALQSLSMRHHIDNTLAVLAEMRRNATSTCTR